MFRFPMLPALAAGLMLGASPALADYELHVLHMNDWHSRIESINAFDANCAPEEEEAGKCFGGAARLVTAVAARRAEGGNLLLLNAGDNFQGSLYYNTYKGEVEAEFLNLLRPDAMTLGNHEFDDGPEVLARFLEQVTFPVLGANVQPVDASELAGKILPYTIVERSGERIGIAGVTSTDTTAISSPGYQTHFEDDAEALARAVEALQAEGINKIIALTHVGLERDLELIAGIPGIDLLVGGHSHDLLRNDGESAVGPYPIWVEHDDGSRTAVVQAGAYSRYLGEISLVFDDEGRIVQASGNPVLLDHSVARDPEALARIEELSGPVEELRKRPISESTAMIDGSREACRARECEMGNLVAGAVLARVADQGVQIVILNAGSLRASIDAGTITMGDILDVLPYQNTIATFQLAGRDVIAALENGVSGLAEGAGRFPQVAGLRYTVDPARPAGDGRISRVEVREADGWAPIERERLYGVATNNFLRSGGDGYTMFRQKAFSAYDHGLNLEDVVAEYLRAHPSYQPLLDGRISLIATPLDASENGMQPAGGADESPEAATDPDALPENAVQAGNEQRHRVQRGDNLWDLAQQYYGDGADWRKILDANPGLRPGRLTVGAELVIPAP